MWPFTNRSSPVENSPVAPATEQRASIENPSVKLSDENAFDLIFGSHYRSTTGQVVTTETALSEPAFLAAVKFISGTLASLPIHAYERMADGKRERALPDLEAILNVAVNDEWTSHAWREYSFQNTLTSGRQYSYIKRTNGLDVREIMPLDPSKLVVQRRNGRREYVYTEGTVQKVYSASEIIDIPFYLDRDQIDHMSPVARMRDTIGLSLAMTDYAGRFFRNGGVPPLAMEAPIATPEGVVRAAKDVEGAIQRAGSQNKNVLVMPIGHKLSPVGFNPEQSQLLDARRFAVEEIARIFQLPPMFLQDLSHGSFANTEQQDLHLVKHTLSQWVHKFEQELNLKLFGPRNMRYFVEMNMDGLLRGDFKTRMEGYATAIQNAIRSPDEVRRLENLAPAGGDAGKLHIQGATVPLGEQSKNGQGSEPSDEQPAQPAQEDDDDTQN